MSERPEAARASEWLEKASHDLVAAEHLLSVADPPLDVVCFHAQQCAEKALKGILVLHGIDPPRTHDLVVLFRRLPPGADAGTEVAALVPLNRHAVEARYPGHWEPIGIEEARDAVAVARGLHRRASALVLPPSSA